MAVPANRPSPKGSPNRSVGTPDGGVGGVRVDEGAVLALVVAVRQVPDRGPVQGEDLVAEPGAGASGELGPGSLQCVGPAEDPDEHLGQHDVAGVGVLPPGSGIDRLEDAGHEDRPGERAVRVERRAAAGLVLVRGHQGRDLRAVVEVGIPGGVREQHPRGDHAGAGHVVAEHRRDRRVELQPSLLDQAAGPAPRPGSCPRLARQKLVSSVTGIRVSRSATPYVPAQATDPWRIRTAWAPGAAGGLCGVCEDGIETWGICLRHAHTLAARRPVSGRAGACAGPSADRVSGDLRRSRG